MSNFTRFSDDIEIDGLKLERGRSKAVIMLHGYGASMNDLAGLYSHLDTDALYDWYFPDGVLATPFGGRAWFPIDMQKLDEAMRSGTHRTFEEECPIEFVHTLEVLKSTINKIEVNYDEIILGGFSQGAMCSTHLMNKCSDKLKSVMLLSGKLLAKGKWEKEKRNVNLPVFCSHGASDPVLSFEGAKRLSSFLQENNHEVEFHEFDGAHEIPMDIINVGREFLLRE